jgi:hypothetical protein
MANLENFVASVEVPSGLKPMGNNTFPIAQAHDILAGHDEDGNEIRLDDKIDGIQSTHWYSGTGTLSNGQLIGVTLTAKLGDMYLNTDTGDVYRCTKGGSWVDARWETICNIKGTNGKSAYEYAKDGGYEGTEDEFTQKIAQAASTNGVYVGETEPTDPTVGVWINPNSGVAIIPTIEHNTCSIFKKVLCVGDSFTSGHIDLGEGNYADQTNEDYSWPSYMARLTGNEYVNCGSSGADVLNWINRTRGGVKAQAAGVVQAYLIGLGLNDVWNENIALGTAADIGTDTNTYYAGMSKIIRWLNAISPKAKIFVQTMASNSSTHTPYNAAIREIVSVYADTYPVHLLDLAAYLPMYKTDLILGDKISGHYTAIGYQMFAENLRVIWSEYINTHIEDFQDVCSLPYDETT